MEDPITEGPLDALRLAMRQARSLPQAKVMVGRDIYVSLHNAVPIESPTYSHPGSGVMGTLNGIEIIVSDEIDADEILVMPTKPVSGSITAPITPEAVKLLTGMEISGGGYARRGPMNSRQFHEEALQHLEKFSDTVTSSPAFAQCKDCGSTDVAVEVTRQMDGDMTWYARCNGCKLTEYVKANPLGGESRQITWEGSTTRTTECSRCGVTQPETRMKRVAHRSRDEATTMLDLCEGCKGLTLCEGSRDGKHANIMSLTETSIANGAKREYMKIGPVPDEVGHGYCLDCHASMYWVWTEGCTGVWAELTWPILADLWEKHG